MLLSRVDEMEVNSERPYDIDGCVQFTIIYDACNLSIQCGNLVLYLARLCLGGSQRQRGPIYRTLQRLGTFAQALAAAPQLLHYVKDGDPIVSLYRPPQSVTQHTNITVKWGVFLSAIFLFRHESKPSIKFNSFLIDIEGQDLFLS
jgi:hypothetical protein